MGKLGNNALAGAAVSSYAGRSRIHWVLCGLAFAVFWICALHDITLPGVYMDAVNPDYIAARFLNSELPNTVWVLPTRGMPILGNLYHGVQNLYVGLPVFKLFGFSVTTLRVAQALFGAAIVGFSFLLLMRATGSAPIACLGALGLATDIAFQASFRTQNYIILGGEAWLVLALLLLYPRPEQEQASRRALVFSGIAYGLSIYGYFVFLFFLPAIAFLVWQSRPQTRRQALLAWANGFVVGMLPYVIGYLLMMLALGGPRALLEFLRDAGGHLSPFSSRLSLIDGYAYALQIARVALANGGNEAMIFGGAATSQWWPSWRLGGGAVLVVLGLLLSLFVGRAPADVRERLNRWMCLLPCSYLLAGGLLGQRLWAHHFSVLVAFVYLLLALALATILRDRRAGAKRGAMMRLGNLLVIACLTLLVLGNLGQQRQFYARLEQTGGVHRASSALTDLADQALAEKQAVYLFPEWGFFMSFAFLTANKVPYILEATPEKIRELHGKYKTVYLAFWESADAEKYEQMFMQAGLGRIERVPMLQRDGGTAFYLIKADL